MTQPIRAIVERIRQQWERTVETVEAQVQVDAPAMDLPQTAVWVKRTTWVIIGGLGVGILWSVLARIDIVVPTRGKLEPQSSSQSVQSRIGGVVTAVLVQEGQQVQRGQLLIQLDKTQLLNQLEALSKQKEPLIKRVAVLQAVRQGKSLNSLNVAGLNLSPELVNRVQNRNLLKAQLSGDPTGLDPDQRQRFDLFVQEMRDKQTVSQFQVDSLQVRASGAQSSTQENLSQLQLEAQQVAQLNPLVRQGAISRRDYAQRVIQLSQLRDRTNQSQVQQDQAMLEGMQAQVDGRRSVADMYRQVQAQLSELDSQIDRTLEQDKTQLIQIEAQLQQANRDLQQQDLRSPVDGIVFAQSIKLPGVVTQAGQSLMQVTPNEALIAQLQVSNADIGNIREGMPVDIRVDAYPFTQFGSIAGVVTKVSSDALPATQQGSGNPAGQTFFLVQARLNRPFLESQGQRLSITPGMSITGNVKTDSRAPISFVADQIVRVFDSARAIR